MANINTTKFKDLFWFAVIYWFVTIITGFIVMMTPVLSSFASVGARLVVLLSGGNIAGIVGSALILGIAFVLGLAMINVWITGWIMKKFKLVGL